MLYRTKAVNQTQRKQHLHWAKSGLLNSRRLTETDSPPTFSHSDSSEPITKHRKKQY